MYEFLKAGNMIFVKLVKTIRELSGLNPWKVYKRFGKKTVQAYVKWENGKRISAEELDTLYDIWHEETGGTQEQFYPLMRKINQDVKKVKKAKKA